MMSRPSPAEQSLPKNILTGREKHRTVSQDVGSAASEAMACEAGYMVCVGLLPLCRQSVVVFEHISPSYGTGIWAFHDKFWHI